MKLKKFKVNVFFFIILFLIFTIKFDFFLNIYIILKNNNDARMISNYGYCYPKGYGFIQEMSSKYNLKDYNINYISFYEKNIINIFVLLILTFI